MARLYSFISRFLPACVRFAWSRARIERGYARDIVAARKAKDFARVTALQDEMRFELDLQGEEEDAHTTRRLRRRASRYYISMPPRYRDDGSLSDYWYEGSQTGNWCLTHAGVRAIRKETRPEQKERRAQVLAWLAAIIGILGAFTGLVSAFRR